MALTLENRLQVVFLVARLLEELEVPYVIGGSFASNAYGNARLTNDVDIAIDLKPSKITRLVHAFEPFFYIDEIAVQRAVELKRSFNAIHSGAIFKVDLFVVPDQPYDRAQFQRRRLHRLVGTSDEVVYLASPEDVILNKLRWLKAGGMVSEQQTRDVASVITIQGSSLDRDYLRAWADKLALRDHLEDAFTKAT